MGHCERYIVMSVAVCIVQASVHRMNVANCVLGIAPIIEIAIFAVVQSDIIYNLKKCNGLILKVDWLEY